MTKLSLILILFFLLVQCSTNSQKVEIENNTIDDFEFSDKRLESIVDSFIQVYPNEKIYELFIDKFNPDVTNIFLSSGSTSAIGYENWKKNQNPSIVINKQEKQVYVYTGAEQYIKRKNSVIDSLFFNENPYSSEKLNSWVIQNNSGNYIVKNSYDYPFTLFMILSNKEFSPPIVEIIEK